MSSLQKLTTECTEHQRFLSKKIIFTYRRRLAKFS